MSEKPAVFHMPLRPSDREDRTDGCRHTNPDICGNHSLEEICAFVRKDGMCLRPPKSWPRQFAKLSSEAER
jgi:hypothetical protein